MPRILSLFLVFLLLTGCGGPSGFAAAGIAYPDSERAVRTEKYFPDTPRETLSYYFDLHYASYIGLQPVDMSRVLDLNAKNIHNLSIWLDQLIQRRRLISEMGLCYVEDTRFPYRIRFLREEELSDGRMELWRDYSFDDGAEAWLHFIIEGEPGQAYPPLMAVNAQHSVRMRKEDEGWRITFHYFPGARRKFFSADGLWLQDDDTVREALLEEFASFEDVEGEFPPPDGAVIYNGRAAAGYGSRYTEAPNPDYYHIGDWMGNCMNFVSQCVAHGFAGNAAASPEEVQGVMASRWYSGGGGGSPAWENVNFFWDFATGSGQMYGRIFDGAARLQAGDIIQTQPDWPGWDEDDYNHCLLVVDDATLKLGQNSPSCFVYYSDLVGVRTRCLRPLYIG